MTAFARVGKSFARESRCSNLGLDHAPRADESQIQITIVEWLRLVLPDALTVHVPNGGSRPIAEAAKFKRMGVVPGMPDILIFMRGGVCIGVEVKSRTGELSHEQTALHGFLREMGFKVGVVRGVPDTRELLANLGIRTREARA